MRAGAGPITSNRIPWNVGGVRDEAAGENRGPGKVRPFTYIRDALNEPSLPRLPPEQQRDRKVLLVLAGRRDVR
jgi:CHAD domain-containing protein